MISLECYYSSHTLLERERNRLKLKDPDDDSEGRVTSIRVSSSSVNLHHGCSDVVFVDVPTNCSEMQQAIGRVYRLGQKKPVNAYLLTLYHTYDQVLQARSARKMMGQLAAQANVTLSSNPSMPQSIESFLSSLHQQSHTTCGQNEQLHSTKFKVALYKALDSTTDEKIISALQMKFLAKTITLVHAKLKQKERQDIIDAFQENLANAADVLIGPMGILGTGYTLTRARQLVICDLDWEE